MAMPSISTVAWDGHGFDVAFAEASELGFSRVEPAFIRGYVDFDESAFSDAASTAMRGTLDVHGLAAQAVSAHLDLTGANAADDLARRIDFVAGIGARILISNAGPRVGLEAILRTIAHSVSRLDDAEVTLALENPGHGSADAFGRAADGVALVKKVDAPCVGLNYDFGNVWTYSGGLLAPQDDFLVARSHTVHAHLKDIRTEGMDWRFCALGQGKVDYAVIASMITQVPAGMELPLRLARPGHGDPVRESDRVPLPGIRAAVAASRDHWLRLTN